MRCLYIYKYVLRHLLLALPKPFSQYSLMVSHVCSLSVASLAPFPHAQLELPFASLWFACAKQGGVADVDTKGLGIHHAKLGNIWLAGSTSIGFGTY